MHVSSVNHVLLFYITPLPACTYYRNVSSSVHVGTLSQPFYTPVYHCLQYAKMEGESYHVTCSTGSTSCLEQYTRFVAIATYLIGPQHSLRYEGWLPTSSTICSSLRGDCCTESKVCFSAALPVVGAHKGLTPYPTQSRWMLALSLNKRLMRIWQCASVSYHNCDCNGVVKSGPLLRAILLLLHFNVKQSLQWLSQTRHTSSVYFDLWTTPVCSHGQVRVRVQFF